MKITSSSLDQFDFLVIGPPRSGTAWMANFLSYGDKSFCWHEPFAGNKTFQSTENKIIGASCSSIPINREEEFKEYCYSCKGPLVYLSKDYDSCINSIQRKMRGTKYEMDRGVFDFAYKKKYKEYSDACFCVNLDITKSDIKSLEAVWNYCFSNKIPFDSQWANHCLLMNVQLQKIHY